MSVNMSKADPAQQGPLPGIGDNRPPDPFAALDHTMRELVAAAVEVAAKGDAIRTEQAAANVANRVKAMVAHLKVIEAERKAQGEPHRAAVAEINARAKKIARPLEVATDQLKRLLLAWHEHQDFIRRAEEVKARASARAAEDMARSAYNVAAENQSNFAARMAAEEAIEEAKAARDAVQRLSKPVATRTGEATAFQRTTWDFSVEAPDLIPPATLWPYILEDQAALERAVRKYVAAGGRDLDGVRIFQTTTAIVR